jgi:hypothetical protein
MIIIGIDPGNVTGMAQYDTEHERPALFREEPYETVGLRLRQWFSYKDVVGRQNIKVGCEKYVMTSGSGPKTSQPAALMTMGVVEDLCRWEGVDWNYYLSSTTKEKSNALLRKIGWWTPTKDGHVNDAYRVILCELGQIHPERYADLVGI